MSKTAPNKKRDTNKNNIEKVDFVFTKRNYQLLLISMIIVVIGFLLMMGTNDIYSFTKITLAPIIVVFGFGFGFFAILYSPKSSSKK